MDGDGRGDEEMRDVMQTRCETASSCLRAVAYLFVSLEWLSMDAVPKLSWTLPRANTSSYTKVCPL